MFLPATLPKRMTGFTLIELLIVIAIILILISIALPNFMEAQIRSKVAHVKAEFKSLEIAVEAYRADYPSYPHNTIYGANKSVKNTYATIDMIHMLTSPNAYMKSVGFKDPFISSGIFGKPQPYTIDCYQYCAYEVFGPAFFGASSQFPAPPSFRNPFDAWSLGSWGPDAANSGVNNIFLYEHHQKFFFHGDKGWGQFFYSPTNGTRSPGDICKVSMSAQAPWSTSYCR